MSSGVFAGFRSTADGLFYCD